MFSRSPSTAPAITATSTTTERIRTGRFSRSATCGIRARMSMPIATGTSTMAKTCSTLSNCRPMLLPSGRKYAADRLTRIGRVNTASTELMAVRVMFRATWPPNRWL